MVVTGHAWRCGSWLLLLAWAGASVSKTAPKFKTSTNQIGGQFVSVQYNGGRFGDNLMAVAHALYFAHKHHSRFLLSSFQYSDQLVLNNSGKLTSNLAQKLPKRLPINGVRDFNHAPKEHPNILFEIPYFPESLIEHAGHTKPYFPVDWEDFGFLALLRTLIAPINRLSLVQPPKHQISVAVHIRHGGRFDDVAAMQAAGQPELLYKFPLLAYYVEQLQLVSELFAHAPLYVFIFTDDLNPIQLTQQIATAVDRPNLTFDCRKTENHDRANVLEDFFSLQQFDILIRPDSNFSLMAEKLGDFAAVITPGNFKAGLKVQYGQMTVRKSLAALKTKYQ